MADPAGGSAPTSRAGRAPGHCVTMETSSPTERRDIFSRSHGLTKRESEVLCHLTDGADTRAVAKAMVISELTVQDHLKSAFTKTSTSSRRELLALASAADRRCPSQRPVAEDVAVSSPIQPHVGTVPPSSILMRRSTLSRCLASKQIGQTRQRPPDQGSSNPTGDEIHCTQVASA